MFAFSMSGQQLFSLSPQLDLYVFQHSPPRVECGKNFPKKRRALRARSGCVHDPTARQHDTNDRGHGNEQENVCVFFALLHPNVGMAVSWRPEFHNADRPPTVKEGGGFAKSYDRLERQTPSGLVRQGCVCNEVLRPQSCPFLFRADRHSHAQVRLAKDDTSTTQPNITFA
jgi:hypothetical protein